ncbi:CENP-B protein 1 [Coniochaeta pulveracea]|uniref:Glucanase n=1 Tax=Coniochaeta pulveracea TaxID=177199 RepID=A0A420YB33_9PEZI|nr:CENP-B protein 1 [Coniochaeta pulveracea]
MHYTLGAALTGLVAVATAQQVGTNDAETHPKVTWQKCTASSCSNVNGEVVIDSNWRWTHVVGGYQNCYDGNEWNKTACPSPEACAKNCALEGSKYQETYGVTTSGNAVTMKFSTTHQYGTNIGSRLYLMNGASKYQMFTMNGNEIAFDVENSKLGCGLNGAVYFVSMDEDGGMAKYPTNKAGAKYGTGYCDSQCARDLKWIGGKGNTNWEPSSTDKNSGIGQMGACCAEMDLWEANSMSFALTPHPCQENKYFVCDGADCGGTYSEERYSGKCDPDGCDLNPFRHGNTDFYGKGKTVDTSKKFTVVTQFHGSGSRLDSISQYFIQNGKKIEVPGSKYVDGGQSITPGFCDAAKDAFGDNKKFQEMGGLKQMGDATGKPMVLVMSVWDDGYANMLWLDGEKYPLDRDPSEPGVARGECATDGSAPEQVRQSQKDASVTYSNFKFGPIGSTYKF